MIEFTKHSGIYTLEVKQFIPLSREEAWEFLSSPGNLKKITPEHMGFLITSGEEDKKMYPGQIITYKVAPFKGIKMNWVTEITHVIEGKYFVDEQRFGPYKFWHHKHFLKEVDGGVEMMDLVSYKIPFGFLGNLMHGLFIKKKLDQVFNYRYNKIEEMTGETASQRNTRFV